MPLVYAMLPHKDYNSYKRMFEKIMEKIVTKPELFGTDYELGELKAIN